MPQGHVTTRVGQVREQSQPVGSSIEPRDRARTSLASLLLDLGQAPDGALGSAMERLGARLEHLTAADSPDDARTLIEGLEQHRFDGLTDGQGRPLRQLAIEALLRLGYPWALQVNPADLDWYRSQAREKKPPRRLLLLTLLAVLAALAGAGWWALSASSAPPPAAAPLPVESGSSVEVFRTESGARLAEVRIVVPPEIPAGASVELGAVRVLSRVEPGLEVLRLQGEGLAIDRTVDGVRNLTMQVPLTPERFDPNTQYFFVIDLWVGWKPVATAITAPFEVTTPPLRQSAQRSPSMAETWAFDAPQPPQLRDSARLLLGVDALGHLRWHQFLAASPADRSAIEAYLDGVKERGLPMFRRKRSDPSERSVPSGGVIDWNPADPRAPPSLPEMGRPHQAPPRPTGP